jgi:putative GTP pyrophosphokinase
MDRIVEKLARFPNMSLATMEDIGGCRVVLRTAADVSLLRSRIEHKWQRHLIRVRDYCATPKPSGYRAVHIVVEKHGVPIEIQLRTLLQHRWAMTVEDYESRTKQALKDAQGHPQLLRLMSVLGDALAQLEATGTVDPQLRAELQILEDEIKKVLP